MAYTLTITELDPNEVTVSETSQPITINYNAISDTTVAVPTGGTTGQVLKKASNTDYDTVWSADEEDLSNNTTSDLAEGTNLYYTNARADARIGAASLADLGDVDAYTVSDLETGTYTLVWSNIPGSEKWIPIDWAVLGPILGPSPFGAFDASSDTTDDLTEGTTNLFYTDARARASISVTDLGGDGSLSYDNVTGVLTYTGPSAGEVRAHFSAGTGVTLSSGEIAIGQAVATTSDVTFNDVTVSGDLTVSGTTTTVNTETINLADNQIVLNSNYSGSTPTENAGIEVNRGGGTEPNKTLVWDETADKWTVGSETFVAGTFEGNLTGNVTGTVSSLSNHDTGDLAEGVNLYYTNTRVNTAFDTRLATKTTDNLTEGATNLYYTTARFDTAFSGKSTSNLTEGTNLYYTDARADARIALETGANLDLSSKSTSDLAEGTNLYFTDERVDDRVSNLLVAGANVSLTYDDVANTLTIAATEDNLSNNTTDDLAEGSTNLYYTDARADARVNLQTGANLDLSSKTTTDLAEGTNLYYTDARWDTKLAAADTDDLSEGATNLYYTDARARSSISLTSSSSDLSYNSTTGEFSYTSPATVAASDSVQLEVRNTTGSTIAKGVPVYISGHSGTKILVAPADADDAAKMPAIGLMSAALANNSDGTVISFGLITGINTSTFTVGDTLYISTTPGGTSFGGLTNSKPASESALIQNIGKVARADSNGEIAVSGPGRSNDVPNLNDGKIFIGNASNQAVTATLDTSLVPENTNLYYTDARFDTRLAAKSTSDLTEGTNLYYTNARVDSEVDAHLNVSGATSNQYLQWSGTDYQWATGAGGGIALTDLSIGAEPAASGNGDLSYNNTSGVFTYTPPTHSGLGGTITEHTDVGISSPQLSQVLKYNGSQWANVFITLPELADVSITTPSSGQVLKYNGAVWVNDTDAGIALTDLSVGTEAAASGDGAISYNNTTGEFTYTPPTAAGIGALANVVEDTTPQLAADLDAQGFGISGAGRSTFNNPSTSSASTAALQADSNGHGAPAFYNTTGWNLFGGNTILGRNFSTSYIDTRSPLHIGAAVQANYTIQTGSFTIDTLDCSMHVVDLSANATVTFSTTTVNRSNANGALGDSGHIMQYEFYANQDGTGGHTLSFAKSGGGATVYEYGSQNTSASARQHCLVRVFHANTGGFNAIHVHWG